MTLSSLKFALQYIMTALSFSMSSIFHITLSRSCEVTEKRAVMFSWSTGLLSDCEACGSQATDVMKSISGEVICSLCSLIADKQKVFDLNPYTIQLVCLLKSRHERVRLLVTVSKTSAFFQSIPQERATVICLRPFCLSEMFNFLAHNGSCTLGKQPLLACLFGRRGSPWIWPGFQMTTHTREMRGWGDEGERGRKSKGGNGEEDPIYFE